MVSELNATRKVYIGFYGRTVEQMPKLIVDGRVPMSVAGLMRKRLEVRNSNAAVETWIYDSFKTGDAVVYHPDGRVKIVLDSQTLREITLKSELRKGALVSTEDAYRASQGEEFKEGELGKVNEWLTKEQVKAHPVLKVLARDQELLRDYADCIFAKGEEMFYYDTAMAVLPSSAQGNTPELRAWFISSFGFGPGSRSDVHGDSDLGVDYGCLVGIAQEALSAPGKGASDIRAYTIEDLRTFDKTMRGLEGTLHPNVLIPFLELRKKLEPYPPKSIGTYTIEDLRTFDKTMRGLEGTLHPNVLIPFLELRKKL